MNVSPSLVGLGIIAFAAFIFMYEYPSMLIFPLNFVFAGLLVAVLVILGAKIIRE
jgi:hypothetical protein